MPWSSGTFSRVHDWTTDAGGGIDIEADRMDEEDDSFAAGIDNTIAKDGQNTPTADLPMDGNRHTGVGNANALNTYASANDLINQSLTYYVDSGAADAYVITPSPAITAYAEGQRFAFRASAANTGTSTLNVNALGTRIIYDPSGGVLPAGAIEAGGYYEVVYDANTTPDRWIMVSSASVLSAQGLRVSDSTGADTATFSHNGTNFNSEFSNTALWNIQLDGLSSGVAFTESGLSRVWVNSTDSRVDIRDGWELVLRDATDADTATFNHDGVDFNTTFSGTTDWDIDGLTYMNLQNGGQLRLLDSGNANAMVFARDGSSGLIDNITDNLIIRAQEANANVQFYVGGTGASTEMLRLSDTSNAVQVRNGNSLSVLDSSGNDSITISHNGAQVNLVATNASAVNFTGAPAYSFDASISAPNVQTTSATTYSVNGSNDGSTTGQALFLDNGSDLTLDVAAAADVGKTFTVVNISNSSGSDILQGASMSAEYTVSTGEGTLGGTNAVRLSARQSAQITVVATNRWHISAPLSSVVTP